MLVYLDSVVCIYAIEGAAPFQIRARSRLAAIQDTGAQVAISDLTWLECRVKPIRLDDRIILAAIEAFLTASNVVRVGLTPAVYDKACRIRALHKYRLADALHLAAAIEGNCDLFLTNDHRLSRFTEIAVEVLDQGGENEVYR